MRPGWSEGPLRVWDGSHCHYGGSGGSSFISGFTGCDAVSNDSTDIVHTGKPYHYSGFVFSDGVMIDGDHEMPGVETDTENGHEGSGYVRITLISGGLIRLTCQMQFHFLHLFRYAFIYIVLS